MNQPHLVRIRLKPKVVHRLAMTVGLLLTAQAFFWLVLIVPAAAGRHARAHSHRDWGLPITGTLRIDGTIQGSSGGPYRQVAVTFAGKFGENQTITTNMLIRDISPRVNVWQQAGTGYTFVARTATDGVLANYGNPKSTPYYSGTHTQGWFVVLGLIISTIIGFLMLRLFVDLADDWVEMRIDPQKFHIVTDAA